MIGKGAVVNGNSGICVLCDEAIWPDDDWVPMNPVQSAHRECSLREVIGGIGHLLAHEYWCHRDTDAGLTRRQSALMVAKLVDLLGVEETIRRGTCEPAAAEEAEQVEGSLASEEDEDAWWRSETQVGDLRWQTDPEQGSASP